MREEIRRAFIEDRLGPHSSHPAVAPDRMRFWRRVGTGVVSAVTAFSAFAVYRAYSGEASLVGGLLSGLRQTIRSTDIVLLGTALGLSATLSAALTVRLSRIGKDVSQRPFSPTVYWSTAAALSVGLLALCVGFAWMLNTTSPRFLSEHRWTVMLAAALPLEALLLYSEWHEVREGQSRAGWLWALLRQAVFAAGIAASCVLLVPDAATSIGTWVFGGGAGSPGVLGALLSKIPGGGFVGAILEKVATKKLSAFVVSAASLLATTGIVTWVTLRVSRAADPDQAAATKAGAGPIRRSFLSRVLGFLSWLNPLRWFRRGQDEGDEGATAAEDSPGMPGWLRAARQELERAIGAAKISFVPRRDPHAVGDSPDFARQIEDRHLDWLFSNRPPTEDQLGALQRFDERWWRHQAQMHRSAYVPSKEHHADLLVQGFPESFDDPEDDGVLELLLACAAVAVVSRGQRVLLLAAGADERVELLTRARARFEAMRLETLYRVEALDPQSMGRWCPPAAAPGTVREERPPDVIVATLPEYEQAFFSGANAQQVIRAVLFGAEVVLVPNLAALAKSREGGSHLPFIVDKHRLLLASENRAMQLVLGSTPIGDRPVDSRERTADEDHDSHASLEAMALRFFGGDARLEGHSLVLRRRAKASPATATVRVAAGQAAAAVDELARRAAAAAGVDAVRLVIGREEARPSPERLAALVAGRDQIDVVHELDCPTRADLASRLDGATTVLFAGAPGDRLRAELATTVDHADLQLVEVTSSTPSPRAPASRWALELPVFPAADSPAMALLHLRSAVSQLGQDSLIRREDLARFGIAWDTTRWAGSGEYRTLHEGWAIELDGSVHRRGAGADELTQLWPAALLRRDVRADRPVALEAPVERGLGLVGRQSLRLAEDGFRPDPDRIATWITQRGQRLGSMDLALQAKLTWEGERQHYRPLSASRNAEGGWVIVGAPSSDPADDPTLPVLEVSLDIPARCRGTAFQLRRSQRMRLFTLADLGDAARCMSTERIVGLMDPRTSAKRTAAVLSASEFTAFGPIGYGLRVGVTVLCLGEDEWLAGMALPAFDQHDGHCEVPAWIAGQWAIGGNEPAGRAFSPTLTRCIQRALAEVAPGAMRFARLAAFRTGPSERGVVVLFIEPFTTVGTMAEALRVILDDPSLRRRFVGRMLEDAHGSGTAQLADAASYRWAGTGELLDLDRQWAGAMVTGMPGGVLDTQGELATIRRDSAAERPDPHPVTFAATAVPASDADAHAWTLPTGSGEVSLSVRIGIDEAAANEATTRFGSVRGDGDPQRLRRVGVRLYEGNRIGPDYEWMIARSIDAVRPLAERLRALADLVGAATDRDRCEVFASFVQSLTYRVSAEGRIRDGKIRFGVQMPLETLFSKQGDCDSLALLLVSLVRAAGLASACMVLVDEADGGHALAAIATEPRSKRDWSVTVRPSARGGSAAPFAIVETTAKGWRIGHVAEEYRGRYVRIEAIG